MVKRLSHWRACVTSRWRSRGMVAQLVTQTTMLSLWEEMRKNPVGQEQRGIEAHRGESSDERDLCKRQHQLRTVAEVSVWPEWQSLR